jgi:hypothetical protein
MPARSNMPCPSEMPRAAHNPTFRLYVEWGRETAVPTTSHTILYSINEEISVCYLQDLPPRSAMPTSTVLPTFINERNLTRRSPLWM